MTKNLEKFDEAIIEGKATWWQMELPSGDVLFGDAKAKMLGYPEDNFKSYNDFTNIVHPEDHDKAMGAMQEHLDGKKELYEVTYRIRHKNGEYIKFYDCGKITNKEGKNITVMGFVLKIEEDADIDEKKSVFKDLIISGSPSVVDLFARIK